MSKKFLTRQDENIEEYGIQITEDTPSPVVTNQSYIDKSDLQLKVSTNTNNFVLSERSRTKEQSLVSNNISIKDAEIFTVDLNTLTPSDVYKISTVFNNGLSEEFLYTKTGNTVGMSLWIKIDQVFSDSSERVIFAYPKENIDNSFKLYIKGNKLFLEKGNNVSYTFTQNQWLHITASYSDTLGIVFYVNGEQVGTAPASGVLASSGTFVITSELQPAKLSGGGLNDFGEIGDSAEWNYYQDALINGSDFVAISAGNSYSLALKADGRVFAWGDNLYGKLGDGTTINKSSPVQVINESDFVAISAGSYHSLALKADGRVFAWGWNLYGQLGDGTETERSSPVQVINESDFVAISAGELHSLALKADGRVFSWGDNFVGQLGDGSLGFISSPRSSPVQVIGQSDFVAIDAGYTHSLALKADGRVFAWGWNNSGQLGNGTITAKASPVQVINESDFVAVSAGIGYSLALKADGRVFSWGGNNGGQLGDGTTTDRSSPIEVQPDPGESNNFVAISAGGTHSLALKPGMLFVWGNPDHAVAVNMNSIQPRPEHEVLYYVQNPYKISAGYTHSLYLEAPSNWSGKISNTEIWDKNLGIDSFLLYKRGYQQSISSLTYPEGLQHQYLMGDGPQYDLNFNPYNLENKTAKLLLNNSDYSTAVVNFKVDGSDSKITNTNPTSDPTKDYIKNNSKRFFDISSTNGIVSTQYKDFDFNTTYLNKDEISSVNAVINKKPEYTTDIPSVPFLRMSAVFDNINYYTVPTSSIPVPGNSVSISCWVKMDPSDTTQQIFKYGDFQLYLDGTTLTLKKGTLITGTATFDLSNPINQGWNHFVATWSYAGAGTGDLYVYRNGVQAIGQTGQNDDGGFGTAPSGVIYIGANIDNSNFRLLGKMANFELWHEKLTQADAALLYSNGYYSNPSVIISKTLALHYLMGDHLMDTYLELNSTTSNTIKALATNIILFDKNDIPS